MKRKIEIVLVLVMAVLAPQPKAASGPFLPDQVPHEGVHYRLAQDRIQISTIVTQTQKQIVQADLSLAPKEETKRDGSVIAQSYADPSMLYVLHLNPKATSDQAMNIHLTEDGLLKSINASSVGRTGDILGNVFKFLGTVLGGVGGGIFAAAAPLPTTSCVDDLTKDPFVHLPKHTRFSIKHSQASCDAWKEIVAIDGQIALLGKNLKSAEGQLGNSKGAALDRLQAKIATFVTRIDGYKKDRSALLTISGRELDLLKSKYKIDAPDKSKTHTANLGLDEVLVGKDLTSGASIDSVTKALEDHSEALRYFEKSGVVIEVNPPPNKYKKTTISSVSDDPSKRSYCTLTLQHGTDGRSSTVDRCKSQFIFYRRPISTGVRIYAKDASGTEIKLISKTELQLLHPEAPHEYLEFSAQRWAKGKLQVTFDAKGVPAQIDWMAESSAAAATGALASAIASARDEYATTMNKLVEIDEAKGKLNPAEKSDLDKKLEELTKEKQLLDAQLALEGSQATYELTLAQQQTSAEIALIQSEMGLLAAQEARVNKLAILRLEAEVARVNKELELLKAKSEIEELSKR